MVGNALIVARRTGVSFIKWKEIHIGNPGVGGHWEPNGHSEIPCSYIKK